MVEISLEEFQNLDLRIGRVISVEDVKDSKNLYKLEVDFGTEKRTAVVGLKKYYSPQALLNKNFVFILNLERRRIMGIESECMILAADDGAGNIVLIQPEKDIAAGSRIR